MNRLINYLIISLIIFPVCKVFTQSTSTYTRYGIGDILYSYSARTLSMGHSGSALINSDYVEILNPASWSGLSRTRIEFSFIYNGILISDNTDSRYYGDGDFKGFTFAFPISEEKGIGAALGIVPYSRANYLIVQNVVDKEAGNYTATYEGKGGLSKIFIGGSYKILYDFIIGATLDYYFGNMRYNSKIEFENTTLFPAEYELRYGSSGFGTNLGLISPDISGIFNSESISDFRLSFVSNIISELSTDSSLITTSSSIVDSIGSGETTMKVPTRFNVGAGIVFNNRYQLAVDYFYQPWSEFTLDSETQKNLKDVHKISLGFEYRPLREIGLSYWEQIMLRAGLSYEMSQYIFYGNDINQYSAFAGFSLPLSEENTFDFAFEYSIRGTKEDNLLQENFFRINFGISFGDIWFQRYEK